MFVYVGTCSVLHSSYLLISAVSFSVCCPITVRNGLATALCVCMLKMVRPSVVLCCHLSSLTVISVVI